MKYHRILAAIKGSPWFCTPAAWESVHDLVTRAIEGRLPKVEADDDCGGLVALFTSQRPPMEIDGNGVATITAHGILGHKLSAIEKSCGAVGYDDIAADFRAAQDQGARGIFFDHDSPGGTVMGCRECAEIIAASTTPVVSFTDSTIASADYYLAAGSTEIIATASSITGSVGCLLPWVDSSKMFELLGLKWEPIVSGDLKGAGAGPSLTEAQRAHFSEMVMDMAGQFFAHVSTHRGGIISDEVFRAGSYGGERALALGLIDGIGDREYAYSRLLDLMGEG